MNDINLKTKIGETKDSTIIEKKPDIKDNVLLLKSMEWEFLCNDNENKCLINTIW